MNMTSTPGVPLYLLQSLPPPGSAPLCLLQSPTLSRKCPHASSSPCPLSESLPPPGSAPPCILQSPAPSSRVTSAGRRRRGASTPRRVEAGGLGEEVTEADDGRPTVHRSAVAVRQTTRNLSGTEQEALVSYGPPGFSKIEVGPGRSWLPPEGRARVCPMRPSRSLWTRLPKACCPSDGRRAAGKASWAGTFEGAHGVVASIPLAKASHVAMLDTDRSQKGKCASPWRRRAGRECFLPNNLIWYIL
ncbi:uncharacterized protein LOC123379431 [Felis catus]|uniref:uncharacterized protein LOC123379431 n=1 Tax=Felis catus TaxID=9685 RepID=UPI001D19FDF1|nr:uncharacterized protein LOC123379431 [Felis catus]